MLFSHFLITILIFLAGIKNGVLIFIRVLAVILILVSAVKLFSEFAQFLHGLYRPCHGSSENQQYWWLYFSYFADLSNWLELPLYILTIVFTSAQFNRSVRVFRQGSGVWVLHRYSCHGHPSYSS